MLHVLALDGDERLERALVRLRLADGSHFMAWVAAGDLRGRQRRNARARWALRVHAGRAAADGSDSQLLELARELGRRRVAAQKRCRNEAAGTDDTLGVGGGRATYDGATWMPRPAGARPQPGAQHKWGERALGSTGARGR